MQIVVDGILTNFLRLNPNRENTLLILHGWGQSAKYWQEILEGLPVETEVIALDLPSFGSTRHLPGIPGVGEYSEFVKNFIEKLKLKNITLLGHSFGGQVGVDFTLRYPKKIKHLILVSPACIRNVQPTNKSKISGLLKPIIQLLPRKIRQKIFENVASSNYLSSTPLQRTILNKILYEDYSTKLVDITIPTSIIWGSEDKTIPYKGSYLAENIPQSFL